MLGEEEALGSVEEIVSALGGPSDTAALAGVSLPAVSNWKSRGFIPSEYFMAFSEALQARGKRASPTVFGFREARQ